VKPSDPQALALGLVRVLADRELRTQLGANGRVSARKYDWPNVAAQVLDAYGRASASAGEAGWRQRGR
jgi:glycosyltransferase involved in cell wall biosynthesis